VIDVSITALILEVVGIQASGGLEPDVVLESYGILEIGAHGKVALERGLSVNTAFLKIRRFQQAGAGLQGSCSLRACPPPARRPPARVAFTSCRPGGSCPNLQALDHTPNTGIAAIELTRVERDIETRALAELGISRAGHGRFASAFMFAASCPASAGLVSPAYGFPPRL